MYSKILAVVAAGLSLASCASRSELNLITRTSQETSRGEVVKRISRIGDGSHAGGLMVSNFYYWRRPQPITAAIMHDLDARARREGCEGGLPPIRYSVTNDPGAHGEAHAIMAIYDCR
ncbi:hypothetical protein FZC33_26640 [Labrys sp. KNU-23]|uniref:hypothetical protein n=1 Tax=Labrys sp. KNU-23 TaxID=2789216 RepID=UPI0011EF1728|nr:hypothetical protein [Labrys sp. KNU-23]QEN89675.1 hypothetical protein FZC33_26640 [Labrys sp. KNU-23]